MQAYYKKVAPPPKQTKTIRELVTQYDDSWWVFAERHWRETRHENVDATRWTLMEKGILPRVSYDDIA